MAKGAYIGVNGVARKIKKGYVGVTEATNLVSDGSFENIASNWNVWLAEPTDASQAKYGNRSLKLGGDALAATQGTIPIVVGHKYYGREYIKTDGELAAADCRFEVIGGTETGEHTFVIGWNRGNYPEWTAISNIIDVDQTPASSYGLRTFTVGGTTNSWVDGIILIDLTATYGAGNEPSKEWCDENIPFFEGVGAVPNPTSAGIARKIKKAYIGVNDVAQEISFANDLVIYVSGDTALREGLTLNGSRISEYITFKSDYIELYHDTANYGWHIGPIDFTQYSILEFDAAFVLPYSYESYQARLGYSATQYVGHNMNQNSINLRGTVQGTRSIVSLDISGVTGNQYIQLTIPTNIAGSTRYLCIYGIALR